MKENRQSRRNFLSKMALGAAGSLGAASIFSACSGMKKSALQSQETGLSLLGQAPDGEPLRAGLVGCGGRGTGAAVNFLDAGPNLEITALGDVFPDQLERCRETLKAARGVEVEDSKCYTGFDSYLKVIDSGVDVVLFATPPQFRPLHVQAAVEAGKHIFQEKPVAVDPPGARLMSETTEEAGRKNLCMVSGTIRRYQKDYIETRQRVRNGAIGEVTGATILRNGGARWWVERRSHWSDMEYMLRNWGNFTWLSGDEIVEKLVHEIDVMSWYMGAHPVRATGYGSRLQRVVGDQFDQFSIAYEYENGREVHCAIRAANGCDNGKKELVSGTEGYADASGALFDWSGERIWEYPYPEEDAEDRTWVVNNPFVQEHVELITAIRTGRTLNDSDEQIKSTRIAIMGRMAAYTGRDVTWEEILNSDMRIGPEIIAPGEVAGIPEVAPVAGRPSAPASRYM